MRYNAHRKAREEQAFFTITEQFQDSLTVNELVNVLYLDTPEEKKWMAKVLTKYPMSDRMQLIDPLWLDIFQENLNKILRKLEKEGKMKALVVNDDDSLQDCDFQMGWTRKNIVWKLNPVGKL